MSNRPQCKLVVIVHADVVGSTALVRVNETLAHERMQAAFRRFSETIRSYGGIAHETLPKRLPFDHENLVERALAADPDFAAAHAWLALHYAYQSFSNAMGFAPEEISKRTRERAEAALVLDDKDPFVHMAASMAFGFSPRPEKARGLHHGDVSVALNPHDADIMYCRACHLAYSGRFEEALQWLDKLRELNPVSTYILSECYADIHYMMGRNYEAPTTFRGQADVPAQVQVVFCGVSCTAWTSRRGSYVYGRFGKRPFQ